MKIMLRILIKRLEKMFYATFIYIMETVYIQWNTETQAMGRTITQKGLKYRHSYLKHNWISYRH